MRVSPTAYNNFVHNRTKTQDRVFRPIAEFYLRLRREARAEWEAEQKRKEARKRRARLVAERAADPYRSALERLLALPPEERRARWERIIAEVRGRSDDPGFLDALEVVVGPYLEELSPPA